MHHTPAADPRTVAGWTGRAPWGNVGGGAGPMVRREIAYHSAVTGQGTLLGKVQISARLIRPSNGVQQLADHR